MIGNCIFKQLDKYPHGKRIVCLGDQQITPGCKRTLDPYIVRTIDYNGAGHINHNLNHLLPLKYHGIADVVIDGGTMEHVANIGECLISVINLLVVNGLIIHVVPVNCYGNSYYAIDPQLLRDFYEANGFTTLDVFILDNMSLSRRIYTWALRLLPAAVLETARAFLKGTDKLKKRILSEGKDIYYEPWPEWIDDPEYINVPFVRRVPLFACSVYVGRKTTDTHNVITWPCQRDYPAAK